MFLWTLVTFTLIFSLVIVLDHFQRNVGFVNLDVLISPSIHLLPLILGQVTGAEA